MVLLTDNIHSDLTMSLFRTAVLDGDFTMALFRTAVLDGDFTMALFRTAVLDGDLTMALFRTVVLDGDLTMALFRTAVLDGDLTMALFRTNKLIPEKYSWIKASLDDSSMDISFLFMFCIYTHSHTNSSTLTKCTCSPPTPKERERERDREGESFCSSHFGFVCFSKSGLSVEILLLKIRNSKKTENSEHIKCGVTVVFIYNRNSSQGDFFLEAFVQFYAQINNNEYVKMNKKGLAHVTFLYPVKFAGHIILWHLL